MQAKDGDVLEWYPHPMTVMEDDRETLRQTTCIYMRMLLQKEGEKYETEIL